eukprot:16276105-Heterocapsa_arctica.AAC.1
MGRPRGKTAPGKMALRAGQGGLQAQAEQVVGSARRRQRRWAWESEAPGRQAPPGFTGQAGTRLEIRVALYLRPRPQPGRAGMPGDPPAKGQPPIHPGRHRGS